MGFSTKLKAHQNILTLETLKFMVEYLVDGNARLAALRIGIPETYAARYGAWLKKRPVVQPMFEKEIDDRDLRKLKKAMMEIDKQMEICKEILGIG
ncbi:MAG: terminase small subunit [Bdellovibrionales bacterium]|nr:terminase small subunit [Bdellovibrionales bacterium]